MALVLKGIEIENFKSYGCRTAETHCRYDKTDVQIKKMTVHIKNKWRSFLLSE